MPLPALRLHPLRAVALALVGVCLAYATGDLIWLPLAVVAAALVAVTRDPAPEPAATGDLLVLRAGAWGDAWRLVDRCRMLDGGRDCQAPPRYTVTGGLTTTADACHHHLADIVDWVQAATGDTAVVVAARQEAPACVAA